MNLTYKDCVMLGAAINKEKQNAEEFMLLSTTNRQFWEERVQAWAQLDEKICALALELDPTR